jgi:hypothetical protein
LESKVLVVSLDENILLDNIELEVCLLDIYEGSQQVTAFGGSRLLLRLTIVDEVLCLF